MFNFFWRNFGLVEEEYNNNNIVGKCKKYVDESIEQNADVIVEVANHS